MDSVTKMLTHFFMILITLGPDSYTAFLYTVLCSFDFAKNFANAKNPRCHLHRWHHALSIIKSPRNQCHLRKRFKMSTRGSRWVSLSEKNGGKQSRDTVPLRDYFSYSGRVENSAI